MLPREKRAIAALSMIYAVRMLGLFMLIPVMVLYAGHFPDSTATLMGVAVGIYGLTQALLQIPFGLLSDYWDRRLVITLGLIIFVMGSLVAAYSETIMWLIVGRALQGAGAIAAAVMALVADSTRDNQRSLAMAIIGGSIGAAFITALILGPVVYSWIGGRGLFLLTAMLAVLAIALLWLVMPATAKAPKSAPAVDGTPISLISIITDRKFIPVNTGIFCLHAVLMASFVAVPLLLRDVLQIATDQHWWVYLVVMCSSLVFMLPCLLLAERRGQGKALLLLAAAVIMLSLLWLAFVMQSKTLVFVALILFFAGFNALEAMLPSMASKQAPPQNKGIIMGVFSTCQFAGVFAGGLIGGMVLDSWGLQAIFIASSGIIAAWLLLAGLSVGFKRGWLSNSES